MRILINIFIILTFSVFWSCKETSNHERIKVTSYKDTIDKESFIKSSYKSRVVLDSALSKRNLDFIQINESDKTVSLMSLCACEKNIISNTLKIQIRTSFPPKTKLKELGLKNSHPPPFISEKGYDIQYRLITFSVQDSIIQNVQLFKLSTEYQFQGKNKVQVDLDKFVLKLNKFNYSRADKILGEFEIIASSGFVIDGENSIVKGTFHCNNNGIYHFNDLDLLIDQTPTEGFIIK
ncbi:hypothetical protein QWY87_10785 [Lutimonas halocynthiae]|uniref:hypothetical protein n=1 Tax=Lutimonas halocynthiae TaxID=1446477 RepID=UPI0025B3E5EA|nr:hypothetical protein [Lutimonas halocynthiae]MDN3643188.1 hypothetical protein [Lutimonas halocynthiae]